MTKTILLADDSVTIQKVIELTFMDEDYEVVAVSNGDDALERLEGSVPDFVIADVHMPGASGYEVARRSKELRPAVPVLLLVGTFEPFDESEARSSGADSFLKKPFDSQELLRLVEDLGQAPAAAASGSVEPAAGGPPPAVPEAIPAPELASAADTPAAPEAAAEPEAEESSWHLAGEEAGEAEGVGGTAAGPSPAAAEPEGDGSEPFRLGEEEPFSFEAEGAGEDLSLGDEEDLFTLEETSAHGQADSVVTPAPPPAAAAASPTPPAPPPAPAAASEPAESVAPPPAVEAAAAPTAPPAEPERPDSAPPTSEEVAASPVSPGAAGADGTGAAAPAAAGLSDQDVERIARRLAELVGPEAIREVAWEVVPDLAEVIIRDRIEELESQVD